MRADRLAAVAALLGAFAPALPAQQWLGVQAVLDVEAWRTGGRSVVLTRDDATALLGRAYVFGVIEPRPGLQLLAGTAAAAATDEREVQLELDHLTLRVAPAALLTLDVGKFALPVGTFAGRRFSPNNPLIGRPDGYPVIYPWGAQLSGRTTRFDYRVALASLPLTSEQYLPAADHILRPAASVGVTPVIGLRLGASWTAGPYLGDGISGDLPPGTQWQDFGERILAADLRFAAGYFELCAELGASWYEVPTYANDVKGTTYYVEAKYAWTPRLFTAARVERNLYAFVRPTGGGNWTARATDFVNTEVGVGFRITARTLVKTSVRWDDWEIAPAQAAFLGEGWAVALQLSQRIGS